MLSRPDIIFATGRSDYPNQVNNVLGFPYIFRGALDVRATKINEEMKLAAAHALAELTRQPVPTMVLRAYGVEKLEFGRTYLIPKPLDPAPAVHRRPRRCEGRRRIGRRQTTDRRLGRLCRESAETLSGISKIRSNDSTGFFLYLPHTRPSLYRKRRNQL